MTTEKDKLIDCIINNNYTHYSIKDINGVILSKDEMYNNLKDHFDNSFTVEELQQMVFKLL